MQNINKRRYEMLIRVRNFGVAHAQLFPANSTAHAAFASVNSEVEQLEKLDVTERLVSHAVRGVRTVAARTVLVESLVRAKNTARVLARSIPQLAAYVELPDPVDERLLITIARQFIAGVAPYLEQFAAHGIAIDDLERQLDAVEIALNERGMRRDEQARARAGIEASLARAMEAVETLDVAVPNHLIADAVKLAAWKRERRVWRSKRTRNAAVPPDPDASPAVAGVTPAALALPPRQTTEGGLG